MNERIAPVSSTGLLVLGMHRSGTSALSGLLARCGVDAGARVLGASVGNEAGHWEDAFAVETHEHLLDLLGSAWNEPFGLPSDWRAHASTAEAARAIAAYVRDDRCRHRCWVMKDPRASLFAPLWLDAIADAGAQPGIVLMLRDPAEVAASLSVRDGLGAAQAALLWLDYTAAAVASTAGHPHVLLTYDALLDDATGVLDRIAALPGVGALQPGTGGMLPDAQRRHHSGAGAISLPNVVQDTWDMLRDAAAEGSGVDALAARVRATADTARELLAPLLGERRRHERKLWERVARAESALALRADPGAAIVEIESIGERMDRQHAALIHVLSKDIREMQQVVAAAQAQAARLEQQRQLAEERNLRTVAELDALKAALDAAAAANDAALATRAVEHAAALAELARRHDAETNARNEAIAERDRLHAAEIAAQAQQRATLQAERDALHAQIDTLDRELVRLRGEHAAASERAHLLDAVLDSRSWRITRPLRVLRRLLGGAWSDADRAQLGQHARSAVVRLPLPERLRGRMVQASLDGEPRQPDALPTQAIAPLITLAPQAHGLADVFVWAVIDWRFRTQRPQHLARALAAKGHRVFYISNNFVDRATPGFSIDPLDEHGRLFQIHLHLDRAPAIYFEMPDAAQVDALRASLAELLAWSGTAASVSIVQHPYWTPLVRAVPNARVVYDCMDHHAGFAENAPAVLEAERRLLVGADLVIVTSDWLAEEVAPHAHAVALIRNAGEYAFFSQRPPEVFADEAGRRIIGYYGAIAEWFDVELVRNVALAFPDALVLLVGSDTAGVGTRLADLANVRMTGEVQYDTLPYWLYGFDVCLLPFRVTPLTLATNPVKAYEYLAAGKPLVSVDLPEMRQFGDLVATAQDGDGFIDAVRDALHDDTQDAVQRRRAFAAAQTWDHRAVELDAALASMREPRVSVVVLAYNGLAMTQACLDSIELYSDYRDLEVIVVDNLSTDGTREWLVDWAATRSPAGHARRIVLNDANLGFSAGNNVGLHAATGEFLVLLNNDTYVTPGWVRNLVAHLREDATLGLVGPVTNNIGNEARIEIRYADMADMIRQAGRYTRAHPGATYPMRTAAFFCVAMSRATYERVGDMDESFGVGFFEDDDYCRRVQAAGLRVACADDVFVHHHLSASFDKLKAETKKQLFERNRAIYEAKWGPWEPHVYRPGGP